MRFEEINKNDAREVNGGMSVPTLIPRNVLIEYVMSRMNTGAAVGAAVGGLGAAIGSIIR